MIADTILASLERVRSTGRDSWSARCPAHDDGTASLSVREADDGKVLVHCFAGCSVHEVVSAVGMKVDDLFPPRTDDHRGKRDRRPFPALAALRAVESEALLAAVAASTLSNGGTLSDEDRDRLLLASRRITDALTAVALEP